MTPEQENELVELFNQGQVWLLLDGVDEMGETNPLAEINHQLRGWLTSAKIVITCRVNVWDAGKNYLQEFDIYRNLDVSEELREEFVNKWFSRQPDLAESLESALNQTGKERIKDLVRNPLRLTLLCSFWQRRQGDLPETKAGLYQQFVKVFYEWKEEYFTTTAKQRRELNQALGILAREAIDKSNSRFRLTHTEVCQYLGDEDSELFNLAIDLGWLNQVGVAAENPDEVVYAFYHPTFQEYFAALTIDDWHFFLTHIPDNPSEGIYRIFEPQWKEVYLLWLGRNDINDEEKEELIETLYDFGGILYQHRANFSAGMGISEYKNCTLSEKIIELVIKNSFGYVDNKQNKWISYSDSFNFQNTQYLPWNLDYKQILLEANHHQLSNYLLNIIKSPFILYILENLTLKDLEIWSKVLYKKTKSIEILNQLLMKIINKDFEGINVPNYRFTPDSYCWYLSYLPDDYDVYSYYKTCIAQILLIINPNNKIAEELLKNDKNFHKYFYERMEKIRSEESGGYIPSFTLFQGTDKSHYREVDHISFIKEYIPTKFLTSNICYSCGLDEELPIRNGLETEINSELKYLKDIYDYEQEDIKQLLSILIDLLKKDDLKIISQCLNLLNHNFSYNDINDINDLLNILLDNVVFILNTYNNNVDIIIDCLQLLQRISTNKEFIIENNIKSISETFNYIFNKNLDKQINLKIIDLYLRFSNQEKLINCSSLESKITTWLENYLDDLEVSDEITITRKLDAINYLSKISANNLYIIDALIYLINNSNFFSFEDNQLALEYNVKKDENYFLEKFISLLKNQNYSKRYAEIIKTLKKGINKKYTYDIQIATWDILWNCAKGINYPEFYQAWHCQPNIHPEMREIMPIGENNLTQSLQQQISVNSLKQLQPTEAVYPIIIDLFSLAGETDQDAITQEISYQIYQQVFPEDLDIPEINNAPQLKRIIAKIKQWVKKEKIALIFYNHEPYSELVNFCQKISNAVNIGWVTNESVSSFIRGFSPNQINLFSVIQNWLNDL